MAREHKSLSKRRAPIYERGARRLTDPGGCPSQRSKTRTSARVSHSLQIVRDSQAWERFRVAGRPRYEPASVFSYRSPGHPHRVGAVVHPPPQVPTRSHQSSGADANAIRALGLQGNTWRRLLTGEQRPDQLLDRQAYIGAAVKLLGAAWRIGLHYLWKRSWPILLAAGAAGGTAGTAVWAALTYAPGGTSRVTTVVVSAAGFLVISWLSIRATLGRALRQSESAL